MEYSTRIPSVQNWLALFVNHTDTAAHASNNSIDGTTLIRSIRMTNASIARSYISKHQRFATQKILYVSQDLWLSRAGDGTSVGTFRDH